MKILEMLPVNKTVTLYSPLYNEEGIKIVRTGTIGDGSCFIHSILHSYSEEYVDNSISERMRYIKEVRKQIAEKISKEDWYNLNDGVIASLSFQESINLFINNLYLILKKVNNISTILDNINNEYLKRLLTNNFLDTEIDINCITCDDFEHIIFPKSFTSNSLLECKDNLRRECVEFIKNKIEDEYYMTWFDKFILDLCVCAEDISYKSYINKINDSNVYVDMYMIDLLSDFFNRDIYIIDSKNRMPYKTDFNNIVKYGKSIIILWISNNHFEIVGKLLEDKYIQREFDTTDPIIEKIKLYLENN